MSQFAFRGSPGLQQVAVSGSPPPPGAGTASSAPPPRGPSPPAAPRCCDTGRPLFTDPLTGQSVCSCQYELLGYQRLAAPGLPLSMYTTPYTDGMAAYFPALGADQAPFYTSTAAGLELKENLAGAAAWPYPSVYHPYDAFATYPFNGYGMDLNGARRKNATRETTSTLKAWLNEHKKNPYPTKGEKIMLAIITKMTLTQVSTWFANARRRLKKENKMTWEPKNKTDDDDDAIVSDSDDKDKDDLLMDDKMKDSRSRDDKDGMHHVKSEHGLEDDDLDEEEERKMLQLHPMLKDEMGGKDCSVGVPIPATKPKIWSLADTAACKTPPPPPPPGQQPWLGAGMMNSFALPAATSISPSAPYSRYGGLLGSSGSYGGGGGGGGGGFPDVQTDTPPQTPPNMKLPSVASNCQASSSGGGYAHHNFFGRLQQAQSPRSQQHAAAAPAPAEGTAFKPFYKSSQPMSGGFVSPV